MRFRPVGLAVVLSLLAGQASAQTNDSDPAETLIHAVRNVCGPNVAGRLPFDLMNSALNGPGVVLADVSDDRDTLAAFSDLEAARMAFGFVVSGTGRINIGVDDTLMWCRVVALDVTSADVAAMQSGLTALDGWAETGQVSPGIVQYLATLDGETVFVRVADPAQTGGYGAAAGLIVTVMNPAAQED